ncbi:hypothetical protein K502DRAFT_304626 [Neoconidiobolus thromboides FSU 785]|nr:hypothetical protein K502DRAFT_304626 [Neoconidiobolus thromboides FSU 785]
MFGNKKRSDSKVNGKKNEVAGSFKQMFGKLTWNYSMRNRGFAQKNHGKMEQNMAKSKGYANGVKHSAKGSSKTWFGSKIGNPRMYTSGKKHTAKGNFLKRIHS